MLQEMKQLQKGTDECAPPPHLSPIFFISIQFSGKIFQIIVWCSLWGLQPVWEIPGSSTYSGNKFISGGSRISPSWGCQPSGVPAYNFAKFFQKLHEIKGFLEPS